MSLWKWYEAIISQSACEGSLIGQKSATHHTEDLQQRYDRSAQFRKL
jgi:hypothetical protein